MWKTFTAGLLLLGLCGCIKIKDELALNADGSGSVKIESVTSLPPEFAASLAGGMGGMGEGVIYPPVNEAEARKFFPAKDFIISVSQKKAGNGDVTNVIEAAFKDVNALLASPYGKAHQLTLKIADGSLVVQGVSGMEATARFAETKPGSEMELGLVPGMADLQKKTNEMRAEFRVTLPETISSANGSHDGKTVAWIVERAKYKDAADFAQQLGTVCEAKCPAANLKMTPVTPARLGLRPFAELAEGVADAGKAVDTNKISATAKFVPYGLSVTRSLDLTGEGSTRENAAVLVGAVTVPAELAPKKWGEPRISEVVDAKGNNLKSSNDDQMRNFAMRSRFSDSENDDSEEAVTNTAAQHVVTLAFRPPDWKAAEIARIKGSISLQYFGGSQVVKLTNAIPTNWIIDQTKIEDGVVSGMDSSEKPFASSALSAIGLSLSMQMGMNQNGMTMLMLQTKGTQAALLDAQVFDASGRPWPTFLQQPSFGGGDEGDASCQIMVAGKPQPPLSLAVLVSGSGSTVEVPILLEHVSLSK